MLPYTAIHKLYLFRILLLFGLLACATSELLAQEDYLFNLRQLNIQDGLSHREVNDIQQDSLGLIWMATKQGLNRYDGHSFKWWTKEEGDLSNNSIDQILEDADGLFLLHGKKVGNDQFLSSQLNIFDPYQEQSITLEDYFGGPLPFDSTEIVSIHLSAEEEVFFYTKSQKLWSFTKTKGFHYSTIPNDFEPLLFHARSFWAEHRGTLIEVHLDGTLLRSIKTPFTRIHNMVKGPSQLYLITGADKVNMPLAYLLNGENVQQIQMPQSLYHSSGIAIQYDTENQAFWLTNIFGLAIIDKMGQVTQVFDDAEEDFIERETNTLFLDRNGLGWIGTDNGVVLVEAKPNLFRRYLYLNPEKYKLEEYYRCRGLLVKNQDLYVNTYRGKYRVDLREGSKERIPELPDNRLRPLSRFPLHQDRLGQIWTGANGLVQLNAAGNQELKIYFTDDKRGRIWAIQERSDGRFWIGSQEGIWEADPAHSDTLYTAITYNEYDELEKALVLDFYVDRQQVTWALSNLGLYILDDKEGVRARYSSRDTGLHYLPVDDIQHLYQDSDGIYWLATNGAGLLRWNRKTGEYQQFDRNTGFSNNNLYAVYEDDYEHLWMSSDYGILQFDKNTFDVKNYGLPDGLTYYEFNRISHFQAADGRIYFGSLNGVTAFDPKDFYELPESQIPLVLSDYYMFEGFGGKLKNKRAALMRENSIRLRPEDRIYHLAVSYLDYFNTNKITYAFKVEGVNEEWKEIKGNNITLDHLPAGQYTLKVKAKKEGNSYAAERFEATILRTLPLHRRPSTILSAVLLLLLLMWWRLRARDARLRKQRLELEQEVVKRTIKIQEDKLLIEKQAEELLEQDKLKTRFFNNIAHELRTPLTLIQGPIQDLLQQRKAEEEEKKLLQMIDRNTEQLLQRVKDILDLAKLESQELVLESKPLNVQKFLEEQLRFFTPYVKNRKIQLELISDQDGDFWIKSDSEKLHSIIHNLLSNALKFSPSESRVQLQLEVQSETFTISVLDEGTGIAPADLTRVFDRFFQARQSDLTAGGGTGIGLALTKELVELMGGEIGVESELEQGSRFWVTLPKVELAEIPAEVKAEAFVNERALAEEELEQWQKENKTERSAKDSRILLVEDNPELREYLQLVLSDHEVIAASNGQEALDYLSQNKQSVQLILSDIMMPVMDGFTFLETLKSKPQTSFIPVVMLTARVATQDRLKALRIGVDDYITKPFVAEELRVKVATLIQNARARETEQSAETIPNVNQQKWLEELENLLIANLSARSFTQDQIATEMLISKRQLSRRIKKLTGLTTNQYLREIRLYQARQMLEKGTYSTISEVSYAVGFEDQHYFSNLYFQRFAIKPIAYFSKSEEDV